MASGWLETKVLPRKASRFPLKSISLMWGVLYCQFQRRANRNTHILPLSCNIWSCWPSSSSSSTLIPALFLWCGCMCLHVHVYSNTKCFYPFPRVLHAFCKALHNLVKRAIKTKYMQFWNLWCMYCMYVLVDCYNVESRLRTDTQNYTKHTTNRHTNFLTPSWQCTENKRELSLTNPPPGSASILAAKIVQAVILGSWSTSSNRSTPGKKSPVFRASRCCNCWTFSLSPLSRFFFPSTTHVRLWLMSRNASSYVTICAICCNFPHSAAS